jgi:hypothetical protein
VDVCAIPRENDCQHWPLSAQSILDLDDEYPRDKKVLVWVETPLNPTGESRSIAHCEPPSPLCFTPLAHTLLFGGRKAARACQAAGLQRYFC